MSPLQMVAEVIAVQEGCTHSMLEQAAGSASPLQLVAEAIAGREVCPYSMLEEAARQVRLL